MKSYTIHDLPTFTLLHIKSILIDRRQNSFPNPKGMLIVHVKETSVGDLMGYLEIQHYWGWGILKYFWISWIFCKHFLKHVGVVALDAWLIQGGLKKISASLTNN